MKRAAARSVFFEQKKQKKEEGNIEDVAKAFVELDRDLGVGARLGSQQRAIVAIGEMIERCGPGSAVTEAALLRASGAFADWSTSNAVRWAVVREVLSRPGAAAAVERAACGSEVVRRLHNVMHSNDPVARAASLRAIALIAPAVGDSVAVHHSVRRALAVPAAVTEAPPELAAAVSAADALCAASGKFAQGAFPIVAGLLESPLVPPAVRIRVVRILRHMHHSAALTHSAHAACAVELRRSPSSPAFVAAALDALTQLSRRSLIDIPAHRALLEQLAAAGDPGIRPAALRGLASLAVTSPRSGFSVPLLFRIAADPAVPSDSRLAAFGVLAVLCRTLYDGILSAHGTELCAVLQRGSDAPEIEAAALSCCESIATRTPAGAPGRLELLRAMGDAVAAGVAAVGSGARAAIDEGLIKAAIGTVRCDPLGSGKRIVLAAVDALCSSTRGPASENGLSRFLVAVSGAEPASVAPHVPRLAASLATAAGTLGAAAISAIGIAAVRVPDGSGLQCAEAALGSLASGRRFWECFRLARAAFCVGAHSLCAKVFSRLAAMVGSSEVRGWLTALASASAAEGFLADDARNVHRAALEHHRAMMAMSGSGGRQRFAFQERFLRARTKMLEAAAEVFSHFTAFPAWQIGLPGACAALCEVATEFSHMSSEGGDFRRLSEATKQQARALQVACLLTAHTASVLSSPGAGTKKGNLPADQLLVLLEAKQAPSSSLLMLRCKSALQVIDGAAPFDPSLRSAEAIRVITQTVLRPLPFPPEFFKYS